MSEIIYGAKNDLFSMTTARQVLYLEPVLIQDKLDFSEDTTAGQAGHSSFKIQNIVEMGLLPLTDNKYRLEVQYLACSRHTE